MQSKVKIPSGIKLLIRRSCNAVLKDEGIAYPVEISVSLIDNNEIRKINYEYRGIDQETDVLSFPLFEKGQHKQLTSDEHPISLGDIVLSMEKAYSQSELYNHSLQREIAFLTVHSMLHLLGYDHEEGGLQEVYIREKEETILTKLGLPRGFNYVSDDE
ncbi:MAG: rRNA maturation RNase YbeY [Oscillospiraceae bacterium]|nr:rRNA maturation RNase YbeY [Oscillospiraceae bacterium]